jgi:hypothetical protein
MTRWRRARNTFLRLIVKLCTDICLQVNNYKHGEDANSFEVTSDKFNKENPQISNKIFTKMK